MSQPSSQIVLRVSRLSSGTTGFNYQRGNEWFSRNHDRLVMFVLALFAFILLA